MKKSILLTVLTLSLVAAIPAHAQGGCVDSPENPTLVLAGLASGVYALSAVRTRVRARRSKKK
jgi:XrtJ-associated TM-motif-TM protein